MQDEAQAVAKRYQDEVDELAHRAQAAGRRLGALPAEALNGQAVQHTFQEGTALLARTRNDLKQIPVRVRAGSNPEEIQKLIAELHEKAGEQLREANAEISAIEGWVAVAERQRASGQAPGPRRRPRRPPKNPHPVTEAARGAAGVASAAQLPVHPASACS